MSIEALNNNTWGNLRRTGDYADFSLTHRTKDGRRDTYNIGRSRSCDITVEDKRVSSSHCLIYCDYTQVRLRVFIEDSSANGTFINDSLTRISKGERLELKSGDQIYLINPRNMHTNIDKMAEFTFVNIRERLVGQRVVAPAPTLTVIAQPEYQLQQQDAMSPSSSIEKVGSGLSVVTSSHIEEHYIIGDQIGSGMSGQVYFCLHRATNAQCAVKVIDTRKFVLTPGLSVADLMEEAAIIQRLDHPNIIKVLSTFQTEHGIHIVMELLKGGDLFDRIVERGRYSEAAARKIMRKILSAVSYLHSHNIIHRDLKPENILLVSAHDDTEIKLTDFGLAKKADQEGLKTFCGTPQYFAPEVLKRKSTVTGAGRYGPAADMWSLGVVLYILLSGTFPFDEDNLFDQIQRANYSMSGSEWAGISVGAKHVVSSLLTLRPDRRLTVTQALQHPWIQNITYNAAAFESETATTGMYRGAASHVRPIVSTQQAVDSQGSSTARGKRRKTPKGAVQVEAFEASELQLRLTAQSSKPHISTLPLFMTNKRPSASASQQHPSNGLLDVYAPLSGSQPTAIPASVATVTIVALSSASPAAGAQNGLLSGEDEIEDCSDDCGSGAEDGEAEKTRPTSRSHTRGAKQGLANNSKRKRIDDKPVAANQNEPSVAVPEVVVLGSPESSQPETGQLVPTKRQCSLESAWKVSSLAARTAHQDIALSAIGTVGEVKSPLDPVADAPPVQPLPSTAKAGKPVSRANTLAAVGGKKDAKLLRAPMKSIAQLFKTASTPK